VIDQRDVALEPEVAQLHRRAVPRGAGAYDGDRRWRAPALRAGPDAARPIPFSGDDHGAVTLTDVIGRDRIQRRRPQGLAAAKAEAGVVPRAEDGVLDDQPLREGAAVVATSRADRADVTAAADENDRLAGDVTADGDAVGERVHRNASGEIGPLGTLRPCAHHGLLSSPRWLEHAANEIPLTHVRQTSC
jgi:hypothetical protein